MIEIIFRLFAGFGAGIFVLWILGSLGIGHFYLYYGPDAIQCTKPATLGKDAT